MRPGGGGEPMMLSMLNVFLVAAEGGDFLSDAGADAADAARRLAERLPDPLPGARAMGLTTWLWYGARSEP